MQAKTTGTSGREMETRRNAEDALSKIRALGSPMLEKTVQEVLEGVKDDDWFPWAVKVSAMRSIPGSLDSLRKYLDRVEQPYRPTASADEIAEATRLVESGQDRATKLALGLPLGPQYALYDDALVAYAELGGKLNEGQRRRLYLFGYACDPRQRLEELLTTGK